MNKATMTGRLTRNVELRNTNNGKSVASFGIAVNRKFKRDDVTADFFNVTCFGATAEFVSKYFTKGQGIAVAGSVQINKYMGRDGIEKTSIDIVADEVDFMGDKKNDNFQNNTNDFKEVDDQQDVPF